MKKKKIMALLMAMSVAAVSPSMFTSPMVAYASGSSEQNNTNPSGTQLQETTGDLDSNEGTIVTNATGNTITANEGKVTLNLGTIKTNEGTIIVNRGSGTVETNSGTGIIDELLETQDPYSLTEGGIYENSAGANVTTNKGDLYVNFGIVESNSGKIYTTGDSGAEVVTNEKDGTVVTNNCLIDNNKGTVTTNNHWIYTNSGTVTTNNSIINTNSGTVEDNFGTISESIDGTVKRNEVEGKVYITLEADTDQTDDAQNDKTDTQTIDELVKKIVEENLGTVYVLNSDSKLNTTYYGVSMNNDSAEGGLYLDSVAQDGTYTYKLPDGYGVDGKVLLKVEGGNYSITDDDASWESKMVQDGDDYYYVISEGDKITITGIVQFKGKWYKISTPQPDGSVTVEEITAEEAAEEISAEKAAEESSSSTSTAKPVKKFMSGSMAGINSWNDVATAIVNNTAAAALTDDVKLFKLELSSDNLVIPTDVVNSLSTSNLDGLHFFIGNSDAITFVKSAELVSYVATDFTHTDTENDVMKVMDFTTPQEIGTTVLLSTKVPVNNAPVVVWKYVNGQYELIGQYESTDTGNVAFPITATGKYALTY